MLVGLYMHVRDRDSAIAEYNAVKAINSELAEHIYRVIYRGEIVSALETRDD